MRKTAFFLAIVFILAGCSRIAEQPSGMKEGETFNWSMQASTENTKTSLDGTTLSWVPGDKIGVFVDDIQTNRAFVNDAGNSFQGAFVCEGEYRANANYYAYYPYVKSASLPSAMQATLPEEQTAPFDGSANYMVATVVSARYDENDMPSVSFQFNKQLMSIVKVTFTNTNAEIASQKVVGVSLIATSGETLTGRFTFDMTDDSPTPVFSPTEKSNKATVTYPTASRPTLGNGISHSVYLLVNPVEADNLKMLVKTTDNVFVATTTTNTVFEKGKVISLPSIDLKNLTPQRRVRQCVLWGDSITQNANYPQAAQKALGSDWTVIGGGIGGDVVLGIAGRQGGIPMCLKGEFTIPASNTESVVVGIPYSTKTRSFADGLTSLGTILPDWYVDYSGGQINPCIIRYNDVEIEGRVIGNGSGWTFTRSSDGEALTVPQGKNASFTSYGARAYKDADVVVIYMGANAGYDNHEVLRDCYRAMFDYTSKKHVIVVGFHFGDMEGSSRKFWTPEYRTLMLTEFEDNFLDLKTEVTKVTLGTEVPEEKYAAAYNLLVETGVLSQGQPMNDADVEALSRGYWPQSFANKSVYSDVHLSTYGAKAMAILVKRKMQALGYLDY